MPSYSQKQTKMHTKRSYIRSRLTAHPKHREVASFVEFEEFGLIDCADAELAFDGGDQRGSLEEGASEGLEGTREEGRIWEGRV